MQHQAKVTLNCNTGNLESTHVHTSTNTRFVYKRLSWCWQTCMTRLEVSQGQQTQY